MILAGVDLAWQSDKNSTAIAHGELKNKVLLVSDIDQNILGLMNVFEYLQGIDGLVGIAVDAPIVIENLTGQRQCEREIGREYGSRNASCHASNKVLYPNANSVELSVYLQKIGYSHLVGKMWQIECYPHPAIIEIFNLPERLKYKKGKVPDKKTGQKMLATLISKLARSTVLKLVVTGSVGKILDHHYIDTLKGQKLKSNEDALDSIVCLYIAGLYAIKHIGRTFGDIGSGYIWVPSGECI